MTDKNQSFFGKLKGYFFAGLLTALPFWVTWLLLSFVFRLLHELGSPFMKTIAGSLPEEASTAVRLFHFWVSVVLMLVLLMLLGWVASWVVGRKVIAIFDRLVNRIPFVRSVYGSVKKLFTALQQQPEGVQRVVLIDFPSPEMKTVGLVTRTFKDDDTGRELAAVYVPTTPNPSSGYLEIVPVDKITSTNWTVDEAMNFIISGGAAAPATMRYERGPSASETMGKKTI